MKLTACMIVKNEENNIARCIESYMDVVAEVIVVDTGSTDKTVEIAETFGAKVYHYEWNNNFADAKNYALDRAKGDWIIFLDADEYFVNGTAQNIIPLIRRLPAQYKAIACKMKNIDYINGKLLDEITHVRIFRRDKAIRYKNSIHESLFYKVKNKTIEAFLVDEKELLIHHTGYSLSNRGQKAKRNLKLLLLELDKAPDEPTIYHYISDCYFSIEEWQKSIEYARMFIDTRIKFVGYNVRPHQNIIDSMLRLKYSVNEILEEIYIGINKFPYHPAFYFYLANMLYDLKKHDEAYQTYEKTLQLQEKYNDIEINSIPSNLYHIYNYMGTIAALRNDYEVALNHCVESLKLKKIQHDCLRRLLIIIKDFPAEDIIILINSLYYKDKQEDLDFIVSVLTGLPLPKVLAYYSAMRVKQYGSDDLTIVYMLLANGQYEKTFEVAKKCLAEESNNKTFEAIAVVSVLMSMCNESLDWIKRHTSEAMRCFVRSVTSNEPVVLSQEYKADYLSFITHLYIFGTKEILDKSVQSARFFDNKDIYLDLANLFYGQECYGEALDLYEHYINTEEVEDEALASLIHSKGICLYRMERYENAVESFINAYDLGYRKNDIYGFLRWGMEKLPSGNIFEKSYSEIIAESKKESMIM